MTMKKHVFGPLAGAILTAAALVAATGVSSASTPPTEGYQPGATSFSTCYSRLGDDTGLGVNSQVYEDSWSRLDDAAATEIPLDSDCVVRDVQVEGTLFCSSAQSEIVEIFADDSGGPGSRLSKQVVQGSAIGGNCGSFDMVLNRPVRLPAGSYWLSVRVNAAYMPGGDAWSWHLTTDGSSTDVWRNPGRGFGVCRAWEALADCTMSPPGQDLTVAVLGKSG